MISGFKKLFSVSSFISHYGSNFDVVKIKKLFKCEKFTSWPLEKPRKEVLHYTVIGTAVDHLARFYFNSDVEKSFRVAKKVLDEHGNLNKIFDFIERKNITTIEKIEKFLKWVREKIREENKQGLPSKNLEKIQSNLLESKKIVGYGRDFKNLLQKLKFSGIKSFFKTIFDNQCQEIIQQEVVNPLSQCRAACVLAIYIGIFRGGIKNTLKGYLDEINRVMNLDLKVFTPLQEMVNRIVNFLKEYGDPVIPDPELKQLNSKQFTIKGDCDYFAKDALIEIKTEKNIKGRYPDDDQVKQLLVYWYMGVKTKRYQIKNLIIYNCFLNLVFTLDLTQINQQKLLNQIGKWIGDSETF